MPHAPRKQNTCKDRAHGFGQASAEHGKAIHSCSVMSGNGPVEGNGERGEDQERKEANKGIQHAQETKGGPRQLSLWCVLVGEQREGNQATKWDAEQGSNPQRLV